MTHSSPRASRSVMTMALSWNKKWRMEPNPNAHPYRRRIRWRLGSRMACLTSLGGMHDLMSLAMDGALLTNEAVMPVPVTLAWIVIGASLFAALFRRLGRDN